jgi:hypothetical protein
MNHRESTNEHQVRRLVHDIDVPVGLIVGAVGGAPSGYSIPSRREQKGLI